MRLRPRATFSTSGSSYFNVTLTTVHHLYNVIFFGKFDSLVKARLMKSVCYSVYGCELWDLSDTSLDGFCAIWRKGLRRSLGLPVISFYYLVFLTLFRCLRKHVNLLLSLFIVVFFRPLRPLSQLFCIVGPITEVRYKSFVFLEICVFSVKCLTGKVVILYLVRCLCHNSICILLDVITIDFLVCKEYDQSVV